jgi:PKD repeat protein
MAFATTVPSFSPPIACFTASPTFGASPLQVQVNASCSSDPDGGTLSYHWNFGDGVAFSGGPQQSHWYTADGPYTITLTVTDPQGHPSVATRNVLVTCGPGIIICPEQ